MGLIREESPFSPGLALLVGAAAGFAAGVLVAGKNGEKLRAEASKAIDEYSAVASGKINEITRQGIDLAREGAKQFEKAKAVAAEKLRQGVDKSEAQAHDAIDNTAMKSHDVVEAAAGTLRYGTNG